jgi:hypothetical protein
MSFVENHEGALWRCDVDSWRVLHARAFVFEKCLKKGDHDNFYRLQRHYWSVGMLYSRSDTLELAKGNKKGASGPIDVVGCSVFFLQLFPA